MFIPLNYILVGIVVGLGTRVAISKVWPGFIPELYLLDNTKHDEHADSDRRDICTLVIIVRRSDIGNGKQRNTTVCGKGIFQINCDDLFTRHANMYLSCLNQSCMILVYDT